MSKTDMSARTPGDPDGVFTPRVRTTVEPAEAADDLEAGLLETLAPLVRGEPSEHKRRRAGLTADGERQRPRFGVPVGPLEDAGLALEPAAVRLRDVVGVGREDVEHEPPAWDQELARRVQRAQPLAVVEEVEKRAKRTRHEPHALLDRRLSEIAEPQVQQVHDAGEPTPLTADLD